MAFLRLIVVFILTFFFLEPFVSSLMIDKEKPIIVVGVDQSESIQGVAQLKDLELGINELKYNLNDNHKVDLYAVGTNTTF